MLNLSMLGLSVVIILVTVMMVMGSSTIYMCQKENKKLKFIEQDWTRTIVSDNRFDIGMTVFMMIYGICCFVTVIIYYIEN